MSERNKSWLRETLVIKIRTGKITKLRRDGKSVPILGRLIMEERSMPGPVRGAEQVR